MKSSAARDLGPLALTLVLAAAGVVAFRFLGFPAADLTGPALVVSLAALAGLPVGIPRRLRDVTFLVLGIGIGTSITPQTVATAAAWPASLVVLCIALFLTMQTCRVVLQRGFGYDRDSAILASTPGHLSFAIAMAAERPVDLPRIALVQSLRVLVLTLLVPPLLALWGVEGAVDLPDGAPLAPLALAGLLLVGAAVAWAYARARVPAALLLAGMTVSGAGHLSGLTPGALPPALGMGAFAVMGALIGTRFRGIGPGALVQGLGAGLAVTVLACGFAVAGAAAVAQALDLPMAQLLIAFAPGGVEAMAAMAVQLQLAPAFVAAHHVARLLFLTVAIPLMLPRRAAP